VSEQLFPAFVNQVCRFFSRRSSFVSFTKVRLGPSSLLSSFGRQSPPRRRGAIAQLFRRKHLNKPFGSLRRGGTAVFVGLPADQHVHLRFLTSWQALSK
jgi:hypothetical protein